MNTAAAKIFSRVILSERTIHIKLLGDSITHGVGGTGFAQNGEPIVGNFSRNPDGHCWAKLFKQYMESQFDCTVVNNGCSGTNIAYIGTHFDELVDGEDDIIICTIGTNNRHQYFDNPPKLTRREFMKNIYNDIVSLHGKFKAAGKDVIFAANIPASASNEKDSDRFWRVCHMNDIHDLYVKASFECGFPLIDFYTLFMEYCEQRGITVDSLLSDGLHPNDEGYNVMFALLMRELGIARKAAGVGN